MGVRVSTRTVWFAVCQHCTRIKIACDPDARVTVFNFDTDAERTAWQPKHCAGHGSADYVVWDVTAGVPDLVAGKDKSVS